MNCTDIGGTGAGAGGDCTLSTEFVCAASPTHVVIPGDLTIENGGAINCEGFDLDLDVGGDLHVQLGESITANGSRGAPGDAG